MQIDKYIQISKLNPNLNYNIKIANEFSKMNCSSEIIIKRYFENQSKEYVEDIKSLDLINSIPISNLTNAYIVILCYNEQESISKIIDLYSKQKGIPNDSFEICFVVNMPQKSQKEYENDYTNFKKSIQIVLDKRKIFSKIHIVCKQFNNNDYGIGRARKYGFDYCLYRISLLNNKNIENTFIISNEGDMVDIPSFYLKKYFDFFNVNKNVLVQGEIDFPDFVRNNKILYHFVETRSRIQLHQGIDSLNFLHFGGIMPIGRNFAVHPRIYAQVNGIDAVFRKGAEDDINFGMDITYLLDRSLKKFIPNPLITNPRREIEIVKNLIEGNNMDSKYVYENFHNIRNIYNYTLDELEYLANNINKLNFNKPLFALLLNGTFTWLFRTIAKNYFQNIEGFQDTILSYQNHEIGYWQKENKLNLLYFTYLQNLGSIKSNQLLNLISNEAIIWFNRLSYSELNFKFSKVQLGLNPVLID